MDDLISRSKALDLVCTKWREHTEPKKQYDMLAKALEEIVFGLKEMPSAQPKKGEWIDDGFKEEWWGEQFTCSICGGTMIGVTKYCADCGARMEVTK